LRAPRNVPLKVSGVERKAGEITPQETQVKETLGGVKKKIVNESVKKGGFDSHRLHVEKSSRMHTVKGENIELCVRGPLYIENKGEKRGLIQIWKEKPEKTSPAARRRKIERSMGCRFDSGKFRERRLHENGVPSISLGEKSSDHVHAESESSIAKGRKEFNSLQ